MMTKVKSEIIALGLAISVLSSSVNAEAGNIATNIDRLQHATKRAVNSELIIMAMTDVDISGKTANVTANVGCNPEITSIDVELILQIYAESAWPTVTSWMYTENDCGLAISRNFTLNASGKYRAKCVITAHRGSKTEKINIYSGEKYYSHKS